MNKIEKLNGERFLRVKAENKNVTHSFITTPVILLHV